jgi:hypothetical protein
MTKVKEIGLVSFYTNNHGSKSENHYVRFAKYDKDGKYIEGSAEECYLSTEKLYELFKPSLKPVPELY